MQPCSLPASFRLPHHLTPTRKLQVGRANLPALPTYHNLDQAIHHITFRPILHRSIVADAWSPTALSAALAQSDCEQMHAKIQCMRVQSHWLLWYHQPSVWISEF